MLKRQLLHWGIAVMSLAMSMTSSVQASDEPIAEARHEIEPGETIGFQTRWLEDGGLVYQGHYRYSVIKKAGELLLRQTGLYTFDNGNRGEEESLLAYRMDRYIPRSFALTITTPRGKVIRTERMIFDPGGLKVHVVRTYDDPTGMDDNGAKDQIDKIVQVPPDCYPRQMFDAVLRVMELKPGMRHKLYCITRMGDVYPMILAEDGSERIKTAVGTFDTVRVRLIPDIPLLPRLMPSLVIRLWYTRQLPRLPVRFEGYAQPPPPRLQKEVRMEITELSRSR